MSSPGTILTNEILAVHGARPDLKLFRNETAGVWAGKFVGRNKVGDVVLRGARHFKCGLREGSADLIGITGPQWEKGPAGLFISSEVKARKDTMKPNQKTWLRVMKEMGAIAGIAKSVQDVTDLLGEPPPSPHRR